VTYYALKILVSAVLIAAISEIAKRSSFLGGLIGSLPLVSILALMWLYLDTRSLEKTSALSYSIFWLVLPSLSLFIALPWLLKRTENFYLSLGGAIAIMAVFYFAMVAALRRFDIEL
jgi:succinate-acetate transporter protein